ncbi:MAG: hypothetical protein M0002_01940 [Rhodospirillales bacterium]|nr:hypothetical protein [Rhodospirillales bacterium]
MFGFRTRSAPPPKTVTLDLGGARLRAAWADLEAAASVTRGVQRYVSALVLKAALFDEVFGGGRVSGLTEEDFLGACAFIAPARRRIAALLAEVGFAPLRLRIARLLDDAADLTGADARMATFADGFPRDRTHRFLRDLAAEILHFTAPEHYPLMTRWVWDAHAGTGVLREIWYAEDMDALRIGAADDFATFATLRDELTGFLRSLGVASDLPLNVSLLAAHIYAGYINDRGGHYLKNEFSRPADPMAHTRRLLGLDAIDTRTGRTRLKLIDGKAAPAAPAVAIRA